MKKSIRVLFMFSRKKRKISAQKLAVHGIAQSQNSNFRKRIIFYKQAIFTDPF